MKGTEISGNIGRVFGVVYVDSKQFDHNCFDSLFLKWSGLLTFFQGIGLATDYYGLSINFKFPFAYQASEIKQIFNVGTHSGLP